MQKSYEGLKDMLKYISRQHFHKDFYQVGAGKSLPKNYIQKRNVIIIGYTDNQLLNTFIDSKEFDLVYLIDKLSSKQLDLIKYEFDSLLNKTLRILQPEQVPGVFRYAWESVDFVYLNVPAKIQYQELLTMYTYTKYWTAGSNFDENIHEDMFRHSSAPKIKFKENEWLFFHEQWAWFWEKDLRNKIVNAKDKTISQSRLKNGTGTIQDGKRYKFYHQDLLVHTNFDAERPFIDYFEGMSVYGDIPEYEESVRDWSMSLVEQTPIELRQEDDLMNKFLECNKILANMSPDEHRKLYDKTDFFKKEHQKLIGNVLSKNLI